MQPSNQLKGLVEAYGQVGTEEASLKKILEKTVVNTIGVYMVSEGYSEEDVVEFITTSSAKKLEDKLDEALESGVATQYITEEGTFNSHHIGVPGAIYEKRIYQEGWGQAIRKGAERIGLDKMLGAGKRLLQRITGFGARPKTTTKKIGDKTVTTVRPSGIKRKITTAGAAASIPDDEDKEAIRQAGGNLLQRTQAAGSAFTKDPNKTKKESFNLSSVSEAVRMSDPKMEKKGPRPTKSTPESRKHRAGMKYENSELDLVVQYLVSEGIAASLDGALTMIEGMSDQYINGILEQMHLGAAMIEFLVQSGEAESLEEANYIISEMDDENIQLLATEIMEKKVYTVTDVDKKGNTEAWKRYQQGNPQYKYAAPLRGV